MTSRAERWMLAAIVTSFILTSSGQLSLNKSVAILQFKENQLGSSDEFRVSIVGVVINNRTLYNVTIEEETAGLTTNFVSPQSNQLTSTGTKRTYVIPTLAAPADVNMTYDARLSNLGADVEPRHDITTTLQYFVTPNIVRTESSSICIEKVEENIQETNVGLSVLIIVICFILGVLVAFFLAILSILRPCSSHPIEPTQKEQRLPANKPYSSKLKGGKSNSAEVGDVEEIFAKDNLNQMLNDVEILELDRLVDLHHNFNEEREYLERSVAAVIISQKGENKETAEEIFRKLKENVGEEKNPGLDGTSRDKEDDLATKHKLEMEDVEDRIGGFNEKFQNEMEALVQRRHKNDVIDHAFVTSLTKKLTSLDTRSRSVDLRLENDDVAMQIAHAQNALLRELAELFSSQVGALEQTTKSRDERVLEWMRERQVTKEGWNKMVRSLMTELSIAEREGIITNNVRQQLFDKIIQSGRAAQAKFERGLRDLPPQQTSIQKQEEYSLNDDINDVDDVTPWLEEKLKMFKAFVDVIDDKHMKRCETITYYQKELLQTVTSQLKIDLDDVRARLRSSLTDRDWDEARLDDIMDDDDIESGEVPQLAPVSRALCRVDDVSVTLLRRAYTSQPFVSVDERRAKTDAENEILRYMLTRSVQQRVRARLQQYQEYMTNTQQQIKQVEPGRDEAGVRRELQTKLTISNEQQYHAVMSSNNETNMTSWAVTENAVSELLRHRACRIVDAHEMEKDRRAMENLIMTLIKCMTSSGQMTTDDCKLFLQDYKSKAEETKEKFALERKRREEMLKRKTARTLQLRTNKIAQFNQSKSSSPINVTDDVMDASTERTEAERVTLHELFANRHEVDVAQQRALLEQELRHLSDVAAASKVCAGDMRKAIKLMFPHKSSEYVFKLNSILGICDRKSSAKHEEWSNFFLSLIREVADNQKQENKPIEQEEYAPTRKLSPLDSALSYPGVRPEPVGRTASPEAEETRYRSNQTKKQSRNKKRLAALKAQQRS